MGIEELKQITDDWFGKVVELKLSAQKQSLLVRIMSRIKPGDTKICIVRIDPDSGMEQEPMMTISANGIERIELAEQG